MASQTVVLDTHALLWFLQGDIRLGPAVKEALANPANVIAIPAIVLAEAVWIIERGRTNIPSPAALVEAMDADGRFLFIPLDRFILEKTIGMNAISEMHDRQIVATTLRLIETGKSVVLATMDEQISRSGLAPIIW